MEPQVGRVDRSGRLVIPRAVRQELELHDGDEVIFTSGDGPNEVRLLSRNGAVERAQAMVRQYTRHEGSVVDAFLAQRRRDAALEARHAVGQAHSRETKPKRTAGPRR